jgi:hypothetical protein
LLAFLSQNLALDFGTADEFFPLPDNTFLVSGLGNRAGLNVGAQVRHSAS